ncbi:MAG: Flp pilus assembly complex ATPase component TadA [Acidobacteriota bacterium]|nr:Flp pilus assembly complex ATPase component TadA [Acidobacteriota bacterium]
MRKKLGECLIQAGLITEDDLRLALAEHKRTRERLGVVLVRMNLATEKQIAKALAYQLGFSYVNLADNPPDPEAVTLIPKEVALKTACIAVRLEKQLLTVAMADPLLFSLVQDLEFQTGRRIKQVVATRSEIIEAIQTSYPDKALARINGGDLAVFARAVPAPGAPAAPPGVPAAPGDAMAPAGGSLIKRPEEEVFEPTVALQERSEAAPIIDLVDLLVKSAIRSHASDVHIEPMEKGVLIRHRLDGLLKEVMDLPKWVHEGLIARLKIMSGMDIAEKRLPQDGRLRVAAEDGSEVDFRVSTLRTLYGEKIVLRVLDHRKGVPPLEELGMSAASLEEIRGFLRFQHGMILVVGPTGSGKTTTLSSAVKSVQSEKTNIITIEDPIEYQIPGVNQTQVNEKVKLTFASALRSILRQDPDVILVGEIRDSETARIAMQAAQTGHLVLSTLHTDDAPSTVTRLTDIGAEPYVIASALIGVVAQRLVRRLCVDCRRQYTPPAETLRALNISEADAATLPFYKSVGCDQCNHTGYRGRIGIYEVMRVTDRLRRLISQRTAEDAIREAALAGGMISLGEDGLAKVKSGITTADELLRVVTEVREMRTLCPGCGTAVAVDFLACPQCGRRLSGGCMSCGRSLQPGWKFCPYCLADTTTGARPKRPRRLKDTNERRELPPSNVAEFKKS